MTRPEKYAVFRPFGNKAGFISPEWIIMAFIVGTLLFVLGGGWGFYFGDEPEDDPGECIARQMQIAAGADGVKPVCPISDATIISSEGRTYCSDPKAHAGPDAGIEHTAAARRWRSGIEPAVPPAAWIPLLKGWVDVSEWRRDGTAVEIRSRVSTGARVINVTILIAVLLLSIGLGMSFFIVLEKSPVRLTIMFLLWLTLMGSGLWAALWSTFGIQTIRVEADGNGGRVTREVFWQKPREYVLTEVQAVWAQDEDVCLLGITAEGRELFTIAAELSKDCKPGGIAAALANGNPVKAIKGENK
jgi:hypothetical protein